MTAAELRARLPGTAPDVTDPGRNRPAAVLVPIEPGGGVWLTRRSNQLTHHAGQVSFPGGKIDPGDASPEAAALREAEEEIGLAGADVEILGRMDDYVTGTGFQITPVIGLIKPQPLFVPDPGEVVAVFRLDFAVLLDRAAPMRRSALFAGRVRDYWVWPHPDHVIWGATAEILHRLAALLRDD